MHLWYKSISKFLKEIGRYKQVRIRHHDGQIWWGEIASISPPKGKKRTLVLNMKWICSLQVGCDKHFKVQEKWIPVHSDPQVPYPLVISLGSYYVQEKKGRLKMITGNVLKAEDENAPEMPKPEQGEIFHFFLIGHESEIKKVGDEYVQRISPSL